MHGAIPRMLEMLDDKTAQYSAARTISNLAPNANDTIDMQVRLVKFEV